MHRSDAFTYDGQNRSKISFPLGGIGTGSIGLSGSGRLIDWEIHNRPAKGSTNGFSHFAVRAEQDGKVLDARVLNGPYLGDRTGDFQAEPSRNYGTGARRDSLAGMPHFETCRFLGRFPTTCITLGDARFPGSVEMTAFNPFIPLNDRDSSVPAAMFAVTVFNTTDTPIDYTVVGVLGHGPHSPTRADYVAQDNLTGVRIVTDATVAGDADYTELMLATDAAETSHQTYLYDGMWFDSLQVYWDDISRPGRFRDRLTVPAFGARGMRRSTAHSLQAAHTTVQPGQRDTIRFVLAWYVPNFAKSWETPVWHFDQPENNDRSWRNWYATEWDGVSAVAHHVFASWPELQAGTELFRDAVHAASLPLPVLDAAMANLSILKTATTVRLQDGTFYGWEGLFQDVGSCEGSCTHVWNYQQALPFLFPTLERSMREIDYRFNSNDAGGMNFRLSLPVGSRAATERPAVDGQFGNMLKLYRDWKLCGDDAWLKRIWPLAKKSVEYAWSTENDDLWDPQRTGVLWGRQHHTLDMEVFGPNVWLTGFYLGALKAGAEIAAYLGDGNTAADWRAMFDRGRSWVDANLFNGEHYVQKLDLADRQALDPYANASVSRRLVGGNIYDLYWSAEHSEIKYQIGDGCIIDQMLGPWHANLYGLGDIFETAHVVSTLRAIYRHNFKTRLGDVANPCRVFGLEEEAGTLICSWPEGARRPAVPVPYAQETMHGFEYAFGCAMMQHDLLDEGVRVFMAVRDRYDGTERNPWNEIECGSNYARSMASWAAVLTLSGFSFDAHEARIGFDPKLRDGLASRQFWSNGTAWGTAELTAGHFALTLLQGVTTLAVLTLPIGDAAVHVALNERRLAARAQAGRISFDRTELAAGDVLRVGCAALSVAGLRDISSF